MNKSKGLIDTGSGMGGFLNPPTHPAHTISVRSVKRDDFCMGLASAVECEYLDDNTKAQAAKILADWQKPAIESPEVQSWVLEVLNYFNHCYRNPDKDPARQWHADNCTIDNDRGAR